MHWINGTLVKPPIDLTDEIKLLLIRGTLPTNLIVPIPGFNVLSVRPNTPNIPFYMVRHHSSMLSKLSRYLNFVQLSRETV